MSDARIFRDLDAPFGRFLGWSCGHAGGLAFGGTDRLICASCAPAAAVLSAFAIQLVAQGIQPLPIVLMMTVLGILTGVIQILIGFLGIGKLIKYIPYPVVSGYLSGVGLIIIGSQRPKFALSGRCIAARCLCRLDSDCPSLWRTDLCGMRMMN